MGHKFAEIAFTESVRKVQAEHGSRQNYAAMDEGEDYHHAIGEQEASFIAQRDSFYMSSVSEAGWPYVQHRGGPVGFMRTLDENTIGFADYRGNRQYVSTGNFLTNDKVSLIFMDYPNRRRLKLLGRIRMVNKGEADILSKLKVDDYRAVIERGFLITVSAFDWNCPQHITPRYSEPEIEAMMSPIIEENQQLKQRLETITRATTIRRATMSITAENRPPLPPFNLATAREKVRLAEDGWNSQDPLRVAQAYTVDSQWRNRSEFIKGRDKIVEFLTKKWNTEQEYRLIKELWAFNGNRIAVRFAYESHDSNHQWKRSYGNENWEFNNSGLMVSRHASINDVLINEKDRLFHWPSGRRPDDHKGLSDFVDL